VVVEGGDLEAVVEGDGHDGVDLVFEEDLVAHDHGVVAHAGEGGPAGEAHRRGQLDAAGDDVEIRAGHGDFEDVLLLVELPLGAGELLDAGGVERVGGLGAGGHVRGGDEGDDQDGQNRAGRNGVHANLRELEVVQT
jgi:hypothetical protein